MRDRFWFFGKSRNTYNIVHILGVPRRLKKSKDEAHSLNYLWVLVLYC